jgi:hypothetical protein
MARKLALKRLDSPLVQRPFYDPKPRLSMADQYEKLSEYRESILARLQELDPDRYPYKVKRRKRQVIEKARIKFFDIHDLVTAPVDHHGPNTGLGMGLDEGGQSESEPNFGEEESRSSGVNIDREKLLELVERHLDDEGENGSLEINGGRLIAKNKGSVLAKIAAFLEEIRKGRGGMIDLELRVYRMDSNLFSKLRSRSANLDARAEKELLDALKSGSATLLSRNRVIAHDGQKVNVRRGDSRSIVADIEINQTGVIPVQNPVINVLHEGLMVEIRPMLDRNSQQVVVDVTLSLSRLQDKLEVRQVEKLNLELAKMNIARTTSTACIPVGKGALLGGAFSQSKTDGNCVVYVKCRQILGQKKKRSK